MSQRRSLIVAELCWVQSSTKLNNITKSVAILSLTLTLTLLSPIDTLK